MTDLLPAPLAVVDARLGELLGDKLSIRGVQRFTVEVLRRSLVSFNDAA